MPTEALGSQPMWGYPLCQPISASGLAHSGLMTPGPGLPERGRGGVAAYAARASWFSPVILGLPLFSEGSTSACDPRPTFPVDAFHPHDVAVHLVERASRRTPDSVLTVICLRANDPGENCRQGYDPSWRFHCGRSEFPREPTPPALLPVRHSPSRRRHRRRWWSLTPPFHPSPAALASSRDSLAGSFTVAVVVRVPPAWTYCFVQ